MSTLSWILQIIFIAGVIYGIRLLNSPETAVKGNFINAASMAGRSLSPWLKPRC